MLNVGGGDYHCACTRVCSSSMYSLAVHFVPRCVWMSRVASHFTVHAGAAHVRTHSLIDFCRHHHCLCCFCDAEDEVTAREPSSAQVMEPRDGGGRVGDALRPPHRLHRRFRVQVSLSLCRRLSARLGFKRPIRLPRPSHGSFSARPHRPPSLHPTSSSSTFSAYTTQVCASVLRHTLHLFIPVTLLSPLLDRMTYPTATPQAESARDAAVTATPDGRRALIPLSVQLKVTAFHTSTCYTSRYHSLSSFSDQRSLSLSLSALPIPRSASARGEPGAAAGVGGAVAGGGTAAGGAGAGKERAAGPTRAPQPGEHPPRRAHRRAAAQGGRAGAADAVNHSNAPAPCSAPYDDRL